MTSFVFRAKMNSMNETILGLTCISEQLKDKLKYPPTAEDAPSLIHKRETRQKDTPTAQAGGVPENAL